MRGQECMHAKSRRSGAPGRDAQAILRELKEDHERVWGSEEGCPEVVAGRRRLKGKSEEHLRVGTWNIRWFPDGCSRAELCPEHETNISWLACTIAWMDLDLLAVQDVRVSNEAELDRLISELNGLTGGRWESDFQECGGKSSRHVGFLWNENKVKLENIRDFWRNQWRCRKEGTRMCRRAPAWPLCLGQDKWRR